MADQLAFDWPTGVSLGPEDFFVSEANAQAFTMISAPETWPDGKLALIGPAGAGKSHLARVFQEDTGAALYHAAALPPAHVSDAKPVIIEDLEQLPRSQEEVLFHLHNNLRAAGGTLLLTAKTAPSNWPIALPDLASRMQATAVVTITDPDDALLSALIMKLFADRQINPTPGLVKYLGRRIERSFAAAQDIVARLDAAAMAQRRQINKGLAAELLDKPD